MGIVAWDVRMGLRAALFTALGFALLFVVTATTDEGDVAAAVRLSRTLPALPIAAALGAFVTTRRARDSGEERAFAGLGRSPLAFVSGSVIGASVVPALFALVVLFAPTIALTAFFPTLQTTTHFYADASGFHSDGLQARVTVGSDGRFVPSFAPDAESSENAKAEGNSRTAAARTPSRLRLRVLAASFLVVAALALTLATGLVRSRASRVLLVFLGVVMASAASVVAFHLVAAGRIDGPFVLLPMVLLLLAALLGYRVRPWHRASA